MIGFYVTMIRGTRVAWLLGPFDSEPQARDRIPDARKLAEAADPRSVFDAFGTAKLERDRLLPGALQHLLR